MIKTKNKYQTFKYLVMVMATVVFPIFTACNNAAVGTGYTGNGTTSFDDIKKIIVIAEHDAVSNKSKIVTLNSEVAYENAVFNWYECADAKLRNARKIENATEKTFEVSPFTERGIKFFFYTATINGKQKTSDVFVVAYTGLPTVHIDTDGGEKIADKENWIGANFKLSAEGLGTDFNDLEIQTEIKGRGNSTWLQPKKPYALKLSKKQKILGMPSHKRWVLLANYLDNSFIKNEMAFYFSRELKMDYTVRGEFVDLVLNGEYIGLYWLGEQIKVDKNRVDIDEENDFLIELDVNYDETWKFKSAKKELPYEVKNDDYMDEGKLSQLKQTINNLEEKLYTNETYDWAEIFTKINAKSFAQFWLVNELMMNGEINWPKSTYATFDTTKNILSLGPVWDFDWSVFSKKNSYTIKNSLYYDVLFLSDDFTQTIKDVWHESNFTPDKITSKADELRNKLSVAQNLDILVWGKHDDPSGTSRNSFDAEIDFVASTLQARCTWLNDEWQ